jgi:competence ComEA-like helix-hairpin-helix protein
MMQAVLRPRTGRNYSLRAISIIVTLAVAAGCHSVPAVPEKVANSSPLPPHETININTAASDELQRLPFVGEALAMRIIEHRKNYGPFRRTEHLMRVRGISDARFRSIRHLIRTE